MSTLFLSAMATLVFCAPGYPGAAGDAQPYVDRFAKITASSAGWIAGSLAATYDPTAQGGLAKLKGADSVLAFVPYAFYVQYGGELHLIPLAQADVADVGTQERWTLVSKATRVPDASSMAGYTIVSVAGYAPDFIEHSVLQAWNLPADVKVENAGQILSALRRAAAEEKVAVLLDQTQSMSLRTLPFASQLKSAMQSVPLPVALIVVVDGRVPAARAKAFQMALLNLNASADGADALSALRLKGFVLPQLPGGAGAAKPTGKP